MCIPDLHTERLLLRAFTGADAHAVGPLVSPREVAATLEAMPHPYPPESARPWIASHAGAAKAGRAYTWAVTRRADAELLAAVSLLVCTHHLQAHGYWVG